MISSSSTYPDTDYQPRKMQNYNALSKLDCGND